jgi:hypothetical protein
MPPAPPVTSATLPANSISTLLFFLSVLASPESQTEDFTPHKFKTGGHVALPSALDQ